MKYDAIIIGSGLGGLTAGAKLAKAGKKVLLVEQHNIAGGCATTFKRKDFTVEVGLHELDGLGELDTKRDIFEDLGVFNNVEFIRLPEFYNYNKPGFNFVMPDNREKAIELLIEKFPEEEKAIRHFFKAIFGIASEIPKIPQKKFWLLLNMPIFPLRFPFTYKNSKNTVGEFMDKNFRDENLKLLLTANLVYYHDDPYTLSMIYFGAAQAGFFEGGHYIKGGSQQLSNYLAKLITDIGGQIIFKHLVEKIIIEKGKAKGIVYREKSKNETVEKTAYADTIIANAAIPNIVNLLPTDEAEKLKSKIEGLENSCSIITLYLGFKTSPKKLGNKYYSTFLVNDETKNLSGFAKDLKYSGFEKRQMVFVDYSQIDSGLAPEGKSLGVIAASDYAKDWDGLSRTEYKSKKEEISQIMIDRLEAFLPGIKKEIEFYELGTAKTVERYTLNPGGSSYGFAQTPKQSGLNRIGIKSPVKGLYFASAWAFPGGGFTGAIISGYLCALKILK